MKCACPIPLTLDQVSMECPNGKQHLRDIIDRALKGRLTALIKDEYLTEEQRILFGKRS